MFLFEEEDMRLKVLKREEEVKNQVMSEKLITLQEQIKTMSSTISDIETALTAKDLPFLKVHLRHLSTQHSIIEISLNLDKSNTCTDPKALIYLSGHDFNTVVLLLCVLFLFIV